MRRQDRIFFVFFGLIAFILTSCDRKDRFVTEKDGWHLVWSDEFDGDSLDRSKWDFQLGTGREYGMEGWGNDELQYYTSENAWVEKGNLIIEARREDKEGMEYTSSRLRTMKDDGTVLFAKTYGRIESRMKLPEGNGLWPALWMLPATKDYGEWAASGEIDIMEAKGRINNRTYGTMHFGYQWPGNKYIGGMYRFDEEQNFSSDYHVYAVEWEPGVIRWYVDDNLFFENNQWWSMADGASEPYPYPAPYDKDFYLLVNFAIGGNYDGYIQPDPSFRKDRLYVDYIRVYDKDSGYNTDVKRPVPVPNEELFASVRRYEDDSFISDKRVVNINTVAMTENEMDMHYNGWYFLTLSEYEGSASCDYINDGELHMRHFTIADAGNQAHSIQLLQHFPVIQGYTYTIEFDAKTSKRRNIAVKVGGDGDNSWSVYSPVYNCELEEQLKHYSYTFMMEYETDLTARLEFNMGLDKNDVYITNVSVKETPVFVSDNSL